jgi:hypothetical protein
MVFGDICKLTGQGELKGSTGKFAERRKSVLQWCCINCCAWVAVGVSCCHGVRYASWWRYVFRKCPGVANCVCWLFVKSLDSLIFHIHSTPASASDQDLFHLPVEPDQPCPEYRSLLFLLPQWFTVAVHLKH